MDTIRTRATPEQIRQLLRNLAAGLAGRGIDPGGVLSGIQLRMGTALLSVVQQDFIVKSRGGTGTDGITWPPLSPATIAARRTSPGERKALGITGRRERGLLTPAENKRWRLLFARRKAWLQAKFGMGDRDAAALAAKYAWATLKAEGAKTKLATLGGRQVDILRDTGLLLQSLSPGTNSPDQILKSEPGAVTVGTNRMPWHHRGVPGRLPARRFWPERGAFPAGYLEPVTLACRRGVLEAVALLVAGRL